MVGVRTGPPRRMVMKRGSRSLGRITDRLYASTSSLPEESPEAFVDAVLEVSGLT